LRRLAQHLQVDARQVQRDTDGAWLVAAADVGAQPHVVALAQPACSLSVLPVGAELAHQLVTHILLFIDLAGRRRGFGQQGPGLDPEQFGSDREELCDNVDLAGGPHALDLLQECVGHLGQGHLGDIELVLLDQPQQQGQRALEDGGVDLVTRLSDE